MGETDTSSPPPTPSRESGSTSGSKPKQRTSPWLWPALVVILIGGVFALFEATQGSSSSPSTPVYVQRPQDVTIKTCTVVDGRLKGSVDVTNHTAVSSTYAVKITFESPDSRTLYDTGTAIINALDPGTSSGETAVAVSKQVGDVPVKCILSGAASYAQS
jgi:hypothetical protein